MSDSRHHGSGSARSGSAQSLHRQHALQAVAHTSRKTKGVRRIQSATETDTIDATAESPQSLLRPFDSCSVRIPSTSVTTSDKSHTQGIPSTGSRILEGNRPQRRLACHAFFVSALIFRPTAAFTLLPRAGSSAFSPAAAPTASSAVTALDYFSLVGVRRYRLRRAFSDAAGRFGSSCNRPSSSARCCSCTLGR